MLETNFFLDDEIVKLREEVKEFVSSVDPELLRKMDRDEVDYPFEFVEEAGKRKLLGLRFPEEYGGRNLSWLAESVAVEEVGVLGMGLGCAYAMISIVGEAIYRFGQEWQKEEFLKPLIRGKKIAAEGLTEPRGGSDFFGTTTKAEKKGNKWILNGAKRFIAGGKVADFYLIYARTDPNAPGHKALTAFIVERDMGVEIEDLHNLMGFKGMGTARIAFKNLEVPDEYRIGEVNGARIVFNRMMIPERLTSAAGAVGLARAAIEIAMKYSDKRKAFGRKIREFQGVSFKVAESVAKLDAARYLVYAAARAADDYDAGKSKVDPRRFVSEAKYLATEFGWEIVNNAMQILGGIGYTQVYPVERMLRDMRLAPIWTGSNEIMKLLIQHEAYKMLKLPSKDRDYEKDAMDWYKEFEKVYE
ncbi:acyl-CoA dehydrogenase domain protein [Ferroglobus placidus DSM 10642]|uniref:Acyl-CoA dehydrogenase domain protein n=1 Tax=Ferroglobus placidus (strain DSM 10642 / AEDII12DO) TaxID=589924 RepID=D3S284_FERPA|nr:acyl-CoA dehydrogenase family protein [Ferroglobus placidus]ADC66575.1 acyl-CoA dehydrogenase domain protein [Ferroglobus placidus DSM 10642]